MFDHVGIRVRDREASERFYDTVIGATGGSPGRRAGEFTLWQHWSLAIAAASPDAPPTENLHVGLYAGSPDVVDAFWRAGVEAGYADDGQPGPRPQYGDDYYGGFLRDPDGNSVEALHYDGRREPGQIDHLWLRVRDLEEAAAFYEAVAPFSGFGREADFPGRVRFRGRAASFSVVVDEQPPTTGAHLAFAAADHETVESFHAAALAAGHRDHGAPGERPQYHPGYYGAFVLDPDGNNVEVVDHGRR